MDVTGIREEFFRAYYDDRSRRQAALLKRQISPPAAPEETLTLSVINQKGGCGKTTTAINLSAYLAEMGYSVLLVDLDPQAHATLGLGIEGDSVEMTVYHLLLRPALSASEVIQPTYHRNLKLIPSNALLAAAQVELLGLPDRERLLKNKLDHLKGFFHFIIIDCPPSLNLLTIVALTAARRLIIPIQTQYYSLDGMRELFRTIELVRQNSNPALDILGILPTLFDWRTKLNRAMLKALKEYFHDQIFETTIHFSAALAECPIMGQPVNRYAPGSRGAEDYRRLAQELITRVTPKDRSFEQSEKTL
ncbi:MAG: ParA family protein [Candidatus Omnitrophica bacterium]|nr:ParA family protein [Candidatus Omnitrophota bacterium]